MEDWIAGAFAVLGTLMIVAGGTLIVLRTLGRVTGGADPDTTVPLGGSAADPATDPAAGRRFSLRRLSPATQLLAWGVLLLVVAACATGLINVGINLNAGT
jgi:hypothetical protein